MEAETSNDQWEDLVFSEILWFEYGREDTGELRLSLQGKSGLLQSFTGRKAEEVCDRLQKWRAGVPRNGEGAAADEPLRHTGPENSGPDLRR